MAAVRLVPYLEDNYDRKFLDNICMMKIDTEGHDVVILEDLKHFKLRPPIIWTEWFHWYQYFDEEEEQILENEHFCTQESAKLFQTILDLGYEIFEPSLPLKLMAGCQNEHYKSDLLLIERKFYQKSLRNIGVKRDRKKWKYSMPRPKHKYKIKPI